MFAFFIFRKLGCMRLRKVRFDFFFAFLKPISLNVPGNFKMEFFNLQAFLAMAHHVGGFPLWGKVPPIFFMHPFRVSGVWKVWFLCLCRKQSLQLAPKCSILQRIWSCAGSFRWPPACIISMPTMSFTVTWSQRMSCWWVCHNYWFAHRIPYENSVCWEQMLCLPSKSEVYIRQEGYFEQHLDENGRMIGFLGSLLNFIP